MYVPPHFAIEDARELHTIMRAHPFALIVTSGDLGLFATHLPTVLKVESDGRATIECHFARANPHWKDLAVATEALVVFGGAHGYISPGWYPSKAETHKVVPTWNYETVHARGRPRVVEDGTWLVRHVGELTDQQESPRAEPWRVGDAPASFIEAMARGIVGFELEIISLEGKRKASQNRSVSDRAGVAAGLRERGAVHDAEMASLVEGVGAAASVPAGS